MVNWNHLLYIIKGCYDHLDAKNKSIVNTTHLRKTH